MLASLVTGALGDVSGTQTRWDLTDNSSKLKCLAAKIKRNSLGQNFPRTYTPQRCCNRDAEFGIYFRLKTGVYQLPLPIVRRALGLSQSMIRDVDGTILY